MSTMLSAWGRRLRTTVVVLLALTATLAAGAYGADPPLVSIPSLTAGGNTVSGSVGSNGTADACVNDQHSGANSSASGDGVVQINDTTCSTSSGQQGGGSSGGGGGSGSGSSGGSTSGGSATRTTASHSGTAAAQAAKLSTWVFASQASGLRIVSIRFLTRGTAATKRFHVLVTLKDVQGRLVRHAIVSTSRLAGAKTTVSGVRSMFTNRLGQARIALPVTKPMLGKQLLLRIGARTPSARARTIGSVLLPSAGAK